MLIMLIRPARWLSRSSSILTGQIVHELLVLRREFQQPSADARLRFPHRDFSDALDLLTVADDPVTFRPNQPASIIPQDTRTPDLTNPGERCGSKVL